MLPFLGTPSWYGGHTTDSAEGPRNNLFVNNTILAPASGGWCIRITDDLGGNVAFNNILIASNPRAGSIALDGTMGFESGSNVVEGRLTLDRGDTLLSLSEWQSAGYGAGSFVSDAGAGIDAGVGPDAGAISDGGPMPDASTPGDSDGGPGDPGATEGCACRVGSSSDAPAWPLALLLGGALAWRRGRRRR